MQNTIDKILSWCPNSCLDAINPRSNTHLSSKIMPLPFSPPFSQMNRDSHGFVVEILFITSHSALQNYTVLGKIIMGAMHLYHG